MLNISFCGNTGNMTGGTITTTGGSVTTAVIQVNTFNYNGVTGDSIASINCFGLLQNIGGGGQPANILINGGFRIELREVSTFNADGSVTLSPIVRQTFNVQNNETEVIGQQLLVNMIPTATFGMTNGLYYAFVLRVMTPLLNQTRDLALSTSLLQRTNTQTGVIRNYTNVAMGNSYVHNIGLYNLYNVMNLGTNVATSVGFRDTTMGGWSAQFNMLSGSVFGTSVSGSMALSSGNLAGGTFGAIGLNSPSIPLRLIAYSTKMLTTGAATSDQQYLIVNSTKITIKQTSNAIKNGWIWLDEPVLIPAYSTVLFAGKIPSGQTDVCRWSTTEQSNHPFWPSSNARVRVITNPSLAGLPTQTDFSVAGNWLPRMNLIFAANQVTGSIDPYSTIHNNMFGGD